MSFKRERLNAVIAYIITIHNKFAERPAYQTYIYKYLALVDFRALEETGRPVTDQDYIALKNGPIPKRIYDSIDFYVDDNDFLTDVKIIEDENGNKIFELKNDTFDLEYLSDYEIELIENTVRKYAHVGMGTKELCDITHEKIKAWKIAWDNRGMFERTDINPLNTFREDFSAERTEEPSVQEEFAILSYSLKQLEKCVVSR